jgi:hypothetical protein
MTTSGAQRQGSGEKWTEATARRVLAACAKSGLSMRAFAASKGLHPLRLYWWKKRLGSEAEEQRGERRVRKRRREPTTRFVPAVVTEGTMVMPARAPIVIRYGRSTMELDAGVSPVWVASVMIELERATCW